MNLKNTQNTKGNNRRRLACIMIVIALLIIPLIAFGATTQNVTELDFNETQPQPGNITDTTAPIITVLSPENTTYNTTAINLNYTIDEPAEWISYSLNGADNVTMIGNITFNASVRLNLNDLVVYARDIAGNTGKAEVQFTVDVNVTTENGNATNVSEYLNITITPKLKLFKTKDHFRADEEPEFIFEFEYAAEEKMLDIAAAESENETIKAFVYDSSGELTDIEPEIEKIRAGKFSIKLPRERAFRAGLYKLSVELVRDERVFIVEKEFPWGLVSLNTRKSIYKPGETAEFILVVLDKDGHPVSGADISMTITNPYDEKTIYSTGAGTILPGEECGLYNASYLTEVEGNHTVAVATTIGGVEVAFDTYFLVKEDYAFDIIRTAQSKIDPTRQDRFVVTIDIESFTDANADSVTIKEFVPAEFDVFSTDADTVLLEDDTETITWNKDLIAGKTSVSYSYSVPHIWPYLYALGPAEINYDGKTFTEARAWYVAVDPETVNATANAIGADDDTNDAIGDLQADDVSGGSPSSVITGDGWYTVDKGDVMFIDGFNTSGMSGTVSAAVLKVQYSVEPDYSGTNPVQWALHGGTLASTGITPANLQEDVSATYDLYAQGVDTLDKISTLDVEFTSNDGAGPSAVSFDYVWITVTYTIPDITPPTITIDEPTVASPVYRKGGEQFYVNFTYTEENPANYTVEVGNSTDVINTTTVNYPAGGTDQIANVSFYLNSSAANGKYNITVKMYDNASNSNISYQNYSVVKQGWSNVTWDSPPDGSSYEVGDTITLTCRVRDANSSTGIQNYPVHFYNRTDSIVTYDFGVNYTNSSGYAVMDWDTTGVAAGWYYPMCNITDNSTLFYNVTANNETNTSIKLYATTLEIKDQNNVTAINSINFSGASGDTVSDPWNNVDGSESKQNITSKTPVATIYNPSSSTNYKIWLKVTNGTGWDTIISDEKFNVTADATSPGDVSGWTTLKPWGGYNDSGVTVNAGEFKDLYLAYYLKGSGTGEATISVLGEAV